MLQGKSLNITWANYGQNAACGMNPLSSGVTQIRMDSCYSLQQDDRSIKMYCTANPDEILQVT